MKISCTAAVFVFGTALIVAACNAGHPRPLKVLENPQTGQRVEFYKEIWYKVPRGYDPKKHLADWTNDQRMKGFTKEVPPPP